MPPVSLCTWAILLQGWSVVLDILLIVWTLQVCEKTSSHMTCCFSYRMHLNFFHLGGRVFRFPRSQAFFQGSSFAQLDVSCLQAITLIWKAGYITIIYLNANSWGHWFPCFYAILNQTFKLLVFQLASSNIKPLSEQPSLGSAVPYDELPCHVLSHHLIHMMSNAYCCVNSCATFYAELRWHTWVPCTESWNPHILSAMKPGGIQPRHA